MPKAKPGTTKTRAVTSRSAPKRNPTLPPPRLSNLPLELVKLIIQHALPELRWRTFEERYSTLCSLALVEKRWTRLAQRELWRHIHAYGIEAIEAISTAIDAFDEDDEFGQVKNGWLDEVVSVRIVTHDAEYSEPAGELLDKIRGFEELWLYAEDDAVGVLLSDSAKAARKVKRLHLRSAWAMDFEPLVNLEELSVLEPSDHSLQILQGPLPKLKSLGCYRWGMEHQSQQYECDKAESVTAELEPFVARLERFVFQPSTVIPDDEHDEEEDLDEIWHDFKALRHLALPLSEDLSDLQLASVILSKIPTTLDTLHLFIEGDPWQIPSIFDDVKVILDAPPECLARLRRLILPYPTKWTLQAQIEEFCKARGVQLEYSTYDQDLQELWEDLMVTW